MELTEGTVRELIQVLTELKQPIKGKQQPSPVVVNKIPLHITPKQAAEQLACTPRTILRMIADKQLDGLPVRSSWSIPLASLQEYIRVHTQKADKVATH